MITDKNADGSIRYEDASGRVRVLRGGQANGLLPSVPTVANVAGAVPAGGTGTAAGGWDTAANRDAAIATITELKAQLNALLTELRARGYIA